jgi:hypothetical protein
MMPVFGKEIVKELNRPLIKDMTSAELYELDFAKMSADERAAFRDELNEKPGHGPLAPAAEHRIYAEAHARWSDWIKDHPEDVEASRLNPQKTQLPKNPQGGPVGPSSGPRPDGTSPRGTGL